ncbi:type II secretion system F family protein [Rugamonas sp. CCM 8940]|uniref:type II secretion system F family protein n=1 Tax=Rugamonas sp. CCM 8940 TaxID=2765359 RepID=UPI0018F6726A|nr:type II secretion system F family protein [Rugamonas sp. CCM 8940]MBJ7311681.1 type II secretion system F family protein [Rugamonas sp. CCM 8940]
MQELLIEHGNGVIALLALACGLSVALCVWLLSAALAGVPREDRAYKDPPPLGFRLAWWPIQWVSHFVAPLLSADHQARILARLRQAGLDYTVTPPQLVGARLVGAALVAALCWWGVGSFEHARDGEAGLPLALYLEIAGGGALLGFFYPSFWLRDLMRERRSELFKTLPFYLDIITLCVEAGLNLQGALHQAVAKGPRGVLRTEIQRVLRDIRAGKARAESMRAMAERLNESNVTQFITAVIQAERMGMNLGPVLRAQAEQRRAERFLRAEKLAMEAPVKMLFPLIAFIFPCTFIVLAFPIAMKFLHPGT